MLQTVPLRKTCLIRVKNSLLNGFPISLALLKRALDSKLDVHALLLLHLEKDLPAFLRDNQRFKAKEFLDIHSLEELRQYLDEQSVAKNSLVFIDSLQLLIERFSLPSTSWLLNQLSELSACVLALVDDDDDDIGEEDGGLGSEEWRRLESVSHTIFQLELAEEEDERGEPIVLCRTMARKRDELFETKVEQFKLAQDYSIQSSVYTEPDAATKIAKQVQALALHEKEQQQQQHKQQHQAGGKFSFDQLPFDVGLNLSEQERRAKANLQLPYMAAQSQKGLVGLNMSAGKKVRAGGQIIYTPDKEDDFDESDPDDDLTI